MKRRIWPAGLLVTGLLLTGCGASQTAADTQGTAASPSPSSSGAAATSGDSMAGMDMGAGATDTSGSSPSRTAKMICGPEIRASVQEVLSLAAKPAVASTWVNKLYACNYALSYGPLVLSVKQSTSDAAANTYFDQHRSTLGKTEKMIGLGERSYGTGDGVVVVVKDDKTLQVDARKLPAVFGPNDAKRADFAFEIASDVMGCWTGSPYS